MLSPSFLPSVLTPPSLKRSHSQIVTKSNGCGLRPLRQHWRAGDGLSRRTWGSRDCVRKRALGVSPHLEILPESQLKRSSQGGLLPLALLPSRGQRRQRVTLLRPVQSTRQSEPKETLCDTNHVSRISRPMSWSPSMFLSFRGTCLSPCRDLTVRPV